MWRSRLARLAQCLRQMRRNGFDQRIEYARRAGDDVAVLFVFPAIERAHQSTGFADQQRAGSGVPGLEPDLPEPVDATGRHIGQVQRRGAGTAQPCGALITVFIMAM